ncbi:MAG: DUF2330 domain-containing protein [Myxococcota bacterium]
MALLTLALPAFACPTIATGTSSPLAFDVAQVAIVHENGRTTFSVSVNPFGDPQEFALVMPVPEVLEESEVRTLDGTIFATLDGYTGPRHVADAGCWQGYYGGYGYDSGCGEGVDMSASSGGGTTTGAVDVEAEYLVGEYQITILSSEESLALQTWLDEHGYSLPPGADERLAEYIESGSFFLAAKVADDAALADGTPLSPLQVSYESDLFYIPIRLATLNSPGEQDMVIYAISSASEGRVGIANYPEFDVPEGCVWGDPATDDFAAFYDEVWTEAWTGVEDAGWAVEFAGGPWDCNPCTSTTVSPEQIAELGYGGSWDEHFLTRIHLRYTPEQAGQDLTLYASGAYDTNVLSYADDVEMNYACVETFCDGTATPDAKGHEGDCAEDEEEGLAEACGCATGAAAPGWIALAIAGLVRRRR